MVVCLYERCPLYFASLGDAHSFYASMLDAHGSFPPIISLKYPTHVMLRIKHIIERQIQLHFQLQSVLLNQLSYQFSLYENKLSQLSTGHFKAVVLLLKIQCSAMFCISFQPAQKVSPPLGQFFCIIFIAFSWISQENTTSRSKVGVCRSMKTVGHSDQGYKSKPVPSIIVQNLFIYCSGMLWFCFYQMVPRNGIQPLYDKRHALVEYCNQ